jgi:hypothetical protein
MYQITDRPELISGRHWILDETQQSSQRITQCPSCAACQASGLPPTRFVLPWASDPASKLRKSLRAESRPPPTRRRPSSRNWSGPCPPPCCFSRSSPKSRFDRMENSSVALNASRTRIQLPRDQKFAVRYPGC